MPRTTRTTVTPQAAALLRLMGKGWHYTPYPATGAQRELQLRNPAGATVAYVVQGKGATTLTTRYRQHGYKGTTGTPAQCAKGTKAHAAAYAKARATANARNGRGKATTARTRGGSSGKAARKAAPAVAATP